MAEVVGYYMTDDDSTARENITDYSPSGLAALESAEANGAILYAVYDDGTETQVTVSQISNPNAGSAGSAAIGTSYSGGSGSGGGGGLTPQSSGWTGTVVVGSTTLEFSGGILVDVA